MRLWFLAALAASSVAALDPHSVYVHDDAAYAAFVSSHPVHRLLLYHEKHDGSLRLLRDDAGSLYPTAAVLASNVSEFKTSAVPRVVFSGDRRRLETSVDNVFSIRDAGVKTRGDHWLLIRGVHSPQLALTLLVEAAEAAPGTVFVYASIVSDRDTADAFAVYPGDANQMHYIVSGSAVRSFEFTTRDEFKSNFS